jgi:hypothetical protein
MDPILHGVMLMCMPELPSLLDKRVLRTFVEL